MRQVTDIQQLTDGSQQAHQLTDKINLTSARTHIGAISKHLLFLLYSQFIERPIKMFCQLLTSIINIIFI